MLIGAAVMIVVDARCNGDAASVTALAFVSRERLAKSDKLSSSPDPVSLLS